MSENKKSIFELMEGKYHFIIPAYQRGYRWGRKEINYLLDDLWPAHKNKPYYLQPLEVVKLGNTDERYRVVDGQQRLTTVYLILQKLHAEGTVFAHTFYLEYDTKSEVTKYMETLTGRNVSESPDIYYISQAVKIINNWFSEKKKATPHIATEFFELLKKTYFFWYCLNDGGGQILSEDELPRLEQEAFNRLNAGKIPLAPVELIKGKLFLSLKGKEAREIVGLEWDQIEHGLHNEDLWSFISQDEFPDNRIRLLFETYGILHSIPNSSATDILYGLLEGNYDFLEVWKEVKAYSRQIEEWYLDKNFYHLIGFLMYMKFDIKKVFKLFNDKKDVLKNKEDFKAELKKQIKKQIKKQFKVSIEQFEEILKTDYRTDSELLSHILLLFNVICADREQNSFLRFPFKFYNDTQRGSGWSLEHIHAQHQAAGRNNNTSESWSQRVKLLKGQLSAVNSSDERATELKKKIKALDADRVTQEQKETIEEYENELFQQISKMTETEMHQITNLALLSRSDNSSISNGFFDAKLKQIKKLDKAGSFIPPGTKNVFLKYYSAEDTSHQTWTKDDREAYGNALKEAIMSFFCGGKMYE